MCSRVLVQIGLMERELIVEVIRERECVVVCRGRYRCQAQETP